MSAAALDSLSVERFSWISSIVSKAKLSKLFKDTSRANPAHISNRIIMS
jgi:hypothetical protein